MIYNFSEKDEHRPTISVKEDKRPDNFDRNEVVNPAKLVLAKVLFQEPDLRKGMSWQNFVNLKFRQVSREDGMGSTIVTIQIIGPKESWDTLQVRVEIVGDKMTVLEEMNVSEVLELPEFSKRFNGATEVTDFRSVNVNQSASSANIKTDEIEIDEKTLRQEARVNRKDRRNRQIIAGRYGQEEM